MDFEAYETFLENLFSVMRGIDCLIQKAKCEKGERFVWSPIAPDIVEKGALSHVWRGLVYTDIEAIPQAILQHIDEDNYVVELTYLANGDDKEPFFYLSIGY